jgi:cytochrome c55X
MALATLISLISIAALSAEPAPDSARPIDAARRGELVRLVRQDCGACHGMTLKGGLGPALLPETLRGKPADSLESVILHGRPNSAMPPWQRFLSAAEAQWIVLHLQQGFPNEN